MPIVIAICLYMPCWQLYCRTDIENRIAIAGCACDYFMTVSSLIGYRKSFYLFNPLSRCDFLHASALSKVANLTTNLAALSFFCPYGSCPVWLADDGCCQCSLFNSRCASCLEIRQRFYPYSVFNFSQHPDRSFGISDLFSVLIHIKIFYTNYLHLVTHMCVIRF